MYSSKVITFIIGIVICCFMVACASTRTYETIIDTQIKKVTIPDDLLTKCDLPEPPSINEYEKYSWLKKEARLIDYSRELIKSNGECNEKITAIKEINDRFKEEEKDRN